MSIQTMPAPSYLDALMSLPSDDRHELIESLSEAEADALLHDWLLWARPDQIAPPGDWQGWLIMAGRGYGKTRSGAEWTRDSARDFALVNIIGATADDARDIMIEGESGILAICPKDERPDYLPSKRRLEWPNGARSLIFTADEPERLRGKQHMRLWMDEIGAWRHPESFDQAMFGLRLGSDPRWCGTTTPKSTALIRALVKDPTVRVTTGSSYDNEANLAPTFFAKIITKYEGTRLGKQELRGELLTDTPGALWTYDSFQRRPIADDYIRVVVAIDPAASANEDSDETGIIVAGKRPDGSYDVIADRSCRLSPDGWARRAVAAFDEFKADRIVAEVNNGGDMVEAVVRTVRKSIPYTKIHASRGKQVRAEPIAALYEQKQVWHVDARDDVRANEFDILEEQQTTWTPESGTSPDRLDAAVWALTELSEGKRAHPGFHID
jgi:phage terminase large subunit-like protein